MAAGRRRRRGRCDRLAGLRRRAAAPADRTLAESELMDPEKRRTGGGGSSGSSPAPGGRGTGCGPDRAARAGVGRGDADQGPVVPVHLEGSVPVPSQPAGSEPSSIHLPEPDGALVVRRLGASACSNRSRPRSRPELGWWAVRRLRAFSPRGARTGHADPSTARVVDSLRRASGCHRVSPNRPGDAHCPRRSGLADATEQRPGEHRTGPLRDAGRRPARMLRARSRAPE